MIEYRVDYYDIHNFLRFSYFYLFIYDLHLVVIVVMMYWGWGIVYWGMFVGDWGGDKLGNRLVDMMAEWLTVNDSIETVVFISGVFDGTFETISIDQAV